MDHGGGGADDRYHENSILKIPYGSMRIWICMGGPKAHKMRFPRFDPMILYIAFSPQANKQHPEIIAQSE